MWHVTFVDAFDPSRRPRRPLLNPGLTATVAEKRAIEFYSECFENCYIIEPVALEVHGSPAEKLSK